MSVKNSLPQNLGGSFKASLHPLLGADEVCGGVWQLVTAIHNKKLNVWYLLIDTHKVMSAMLIFVMFILVWPELK